MAELADLIPSAKLTPNNGATNYVQPTDTVPDGLGYTEAALFLTVQGIDRQGGTITVRVDTAVDNREENYVALADLATFTSDPAGYPDKHYVYLKGSSAGSSTPGFARYLRVVAEMDSASASITCGVKAVFKP